MKRQAVASKRPTSSQKTHPLNIRGCIEIRTYPREFLGFCESGCTYKSKGSTARRAGDSMVQRGRQRLGEKVSATVEVSVMGHRLLLCKHCGKEAKDFWAKFCEDYVEGNPNTVMVRERIAKQKEENRRLKAKRKNFRQQRRPLPEDYE